MTIKSTLTKAELDEVWVDSRGLSTFEAVREVANAAAARERERIIELFEKTAPISVFLAVLRTLENTV